MILINKIIIIIVSILFIQCSNIDRKNRINFSEEKKQAQDRIHKKTPLPIQLEKLSEAQRKVMLDLQNADTSSYLIRSRPILFQIQGIKKSEGNQQRNTLPFYRDVDLFIYALGEAKDSVLVDYGWIENAATGEVVWKMMFENSVHGGGDPRNRKVVGNIHLPAGTYSLYFIYNESHQNGDWQGGPPERPFYYGITVFNLYAIERINDLAE